MTNPNLTHIVAILDRSGSMHSIKKDTEGGFDAFIDKQKEVPGEVKVTLVQFDNTIDTVYENRPLSEVPKLNLQPRGGTALYDAMGQTIQRVGANLASLPENERPGSVIFVILTDGWENASREWTAASLREAVTHQTQKYGWQFIFMGSNQDAVLTAQTIGIGMGSALTYTGVNVNNAFVSAANYSNAFRGSMAKGIPVASAAAASSFTYVDRAEAVGEDVDKEEE